MGVGYFLVVLLLIVGSFIALRRFKASSDRTQPRETNGTFPETKRIFETLSNDQKWLLARLIDEGSLPAADWNSCLESVIFVERDQASGKTNFRPEYQSDLTRIVKERQPSVRGPKTDDSVPRGGDVRQSRLADAPL